MTTSRLALIRAALLASALSATPLPGQILDLPPRPGDAPTGSEFVAEITGLDLAEREVAIFHAVLDGNVPDFLRQLVPVTVTEGGHTGVFRVTPDHMAVGSDEDYFLTPMSPMLATWIGDATGCTLPTRKMVDAIWAAAEVQLAPQPIPPSPEMTTVPVFNDHNTMVWTQRAAVLSAHPLGALVGGTKKDVVITPQLHTGGREDRVAIYGWHYLTGDPIQPLYLGHTNTWVDYSHGNRLVLNEMTVDGAPTTVQAVLGDPDLAALLSDEGAWDNPGYTVPPAPPRPDPPEAILLTGASSLSASAVSH